MNKRELTRSARVRFLALSGLLAALLLAGTLSISASAASVRPKRVRAAAQELAPNSMITIGAALPLSGPGDVSAGLAMKTALEIALDEINAAGGVLGQPLQLLISDTAGTASLGAAAMDRFAASGAAGVVGEYHSGVAFSMTEKAREHHLPLLLSETWADGLTGSGYEEVFRIGPVISRILGTAAAYLDELGVANVAIHMDDGGGSSFVSAYLEPALALRAISWQTFTSEVGTTDYGAVIAAMQAHEPRPQAVISLLTDADALNFTQQSAAAGLAPAADVLLINYVYGPIPNVSEDADRFWQEAPAGNYTIFSRLGTVPANYNDRTNTFLAEYQSRTGKPAAEYYAMEAYDSLLIMADAIEQAGSAAPDAVIAALESTNFVGAQGRYYFPYGNSNPVPVGTPAYMWHQWPDTPALLLQYYEAGQSLAEAAVVYPPVYRTHDLNLIPYGGSAATLPVEDASTLTVSDTQGLTIEIDVAAGALTQTATLIYSPLVTATADANFLFAGRAFALEAYRDGAQVDDLNFERPVTITMAYSDADLDGVDESSLTILTRADAGSDWVDAAESCSPPSVYERQVDDNRLRVAICHLSQFALFGRSYQVYLPTLESRP